jgi:hypothetical protein
LAARFTVLKPKSTVSEGLSLGMNKL